MTPVPAVDPARAAAIVERISTCRLLVLGDVMLDQFIIGRTTRISPDGPVPVLAFERDEYRAGGAANVAAKARALGASIDLIGLVGADAAATRLMEQLHAADVGGSSLLTDAARRTTTQVRVVTSRTQQVAQVDYESADPVTPAIEAAIIEQLDAHAPRASAIVVSDYAKGVVTERVMAAVVAAGQRHDTPVLVDPVGSHLDLYAGATIVTPTDAEVEAAVHIRIRTEDEARRAAAAFRERSRAKAVLISRDAHGMWLAGDDIEGHLPAATRDVADVTGANDTVIATLALAIAAGATMVEAAHLANHAAGISVATFGAAAVTAELLRAVCRNEA